MIELIISFIIVWCVGFYLHELMHYLEAKRQGCDAKIRLWLYKDIIPSLEIKITKGVLQSSPLFYRWDRVFWFFPLRFLSGVLLMRPSLPETSSSFF